MFRAWRRRGFGSRLFRRRGGAVAFERGGQTGVARQGGDGLGLDFDGFGDAAGIEQRPRVGVEDVAVLGFGELQRLLGEPRGQRQIALPDGFEEVDRRDYGETQVRFLKAG